jgi:hypothetical protein
MEVDVVVAAMSNKKNTVVKINPVIFLFLLKIAVLLDIVYTSSYILKFFGFFSACLCPLCDRELTKLTEKESPAPAAKKSSAVLRLSHTAG